MTRAVEAELQQLRQQLLAMGGLAETMIQESVRSLVERNADLAHMVFRYEEEMDQRCIALDDRSFKLIALRQPEAIPTALNIVLISRNLERIADHATNIAEDVIYIVRGEDVRERGDKEIRKGIRTRGEVPKVPLTLPAAGPIARTLQEEQDPFGS